MVVVTGVLAVVALAAALVALRLPGQPASNPASQLQAARPVSDALGSALANGAAEAIAHMPEPTASAAASARAPLPKPSPSTTPTASPSPSQQAAPVYLNPLRSVSGLVPERVDMGVDFGGAGPVYAIGDGVVTNATADSSGWPGGGWITYQLTDGPAAGLMVYVAEDVTPTVTVGQQVTPQTVIANMYNGGDGIETGWATSDGSTAESQTSAAGAIGGDGPFPTQIGLSFDALLRALGVPAGIGVGEAGSGLLPAGYLASWPGLTPGS